MDRKQLESV